ncbi:MAG: tetratricopeptide repeat protein [Chthoniobacterales bacterium]
MSRKRAKNAKTTAALADFAVWNTLKFALGIALLTFLLYVPSLKSDFVYDAEYQVLNNDYIHTPSNFAEVISLRVLNRDVLDNNRPVQLLSLMLNSLCFGQRSFGYHLTNILIHCINATLLVILLTELFGATRRSRVAIACGVLVFALHPVNVEVVAEVSSREDALAALFILTGLLLAVKFSVVNERTKWFYAAGTLFAFLLAVGSKETGVAAPFLLGLYWLLYKRGERSRDWAVFITCAFFVVGAFIFARFAFQPQMVKTFVQAPTYLGGSFAKVFLYEPRIWAFLIHNIFWPFHLSADYVVKDMAWISLPAALVTLALFVSAQFGLAWKNKVALFGVVLFWLALAPASNFIPLFRPAADRFLYLPMVGLALSVSALLFLVYGNRNLYRSLVVICVLSLCVMAGLTWKRQAVFSNSLNLWRDTIVKSPFSIIAENNLGYTLMDHGNYAEAITAFERSLQISKGGFPDSWLGASIAFEKLGRSSDADRALKKAIALNPIFSDSQKLLDAAIINRQNIPVIDVISARISPK